MEAYLWRIDYRFLPERYFEDLKKYEEDKDNSPVISDNNRVYIDSSNITLSSTSDVNVSQYAPSQTAEEVQAVAQPMSERMTGTWSELPVWQLFLRSKPLKDSYIEYVTGIRDAYYIGFDPTGQDIFAQIKEEKFPARTLAEVDFHIEKLIGLGKISIPSVKVQNLQRKLEI